MSSFDLKPAMTIPGEYRVVRSIGLGATSEVFEAVKIDTCERVALKVFSPLILSDADAVQRLRGEVEALEKLRHANIVALRATCARTDFFALELELIDGADLRQWAVGYDSSLHEPKMWMLAQVARGLGAAHENGVLHRDLKPENVLVGHNGVVKLTDFGLSRSISRLTLTRMGLLVGSLGYMAPECVNGLRADERSDLFSFGVIAYELLAGRAPFEAETPQALIKKITTGEFESLSAACPSIPEAVSAIIDCCLAIDPDGRPESSWSVEAVLMNSLMTTGLLPHCRALVSTSARADELTLALKAKHEKLSGRVSGLMKSYLAFPHSASASEKAQKRRQLLPAINELKRIFPEDPLIAESLSVMTTGAVKSGLAPARKPMMIAAVIGFLVLMALPLLKSQFFPAQSKSRETIARIAPINAELGMSTVIPPLASEIQKNLQTNLQKPVSTPSRKHVAQKPILGRLVFEADQDVDIYVDGKFVSPTAWASYEAPAGKRNVRLVKAGFEPIENIVDVKPSQATVVRAKR